MSRRIYIAGPMRGRPDLNFPAFNRAAELFRSLGWEVANPVEIGQRVFGDKPATSEDYVRADIRELCDCTAIALLSGWETSTGARCEAAVAVTLGLTFYDERTEQRERPASISCVGGYDCEPGAVAPAGRIADLERELAQAREDIRLARQYITDREFYCEGCGEFQPVTEDSCDIVCQHRHVITAFRYREGVVGETREQLRERAERAEAGFAAAQKIAEGYKGDAQIAIEVASEAMTKADRAVARAERAESELAETHKAFVSTRDYAREQITRAERAEADSARLDWLESETHVIPLARNERQWDAFAIPYNAGKGLRAAIDAARAAEQGPK